MSRLNIINKIVKDNNVKDYLEIGVFTGFTLDGCKAPNKIGIDPECHHYIGKEKVFCGTSDEFFRQLEPTKKFQLCFIDGLHEAEQVYRDIKNALKRLNEGGTIVLHDCNPPEYAHTTTGINGCWTGDTYKAVLRFQSENIFGTYNYKTIDTDWGCGILTKNNIVIENIPKFSYNKAIQDWNYFDEHRTELLNLVNYEEWKKS